MIKSGDIASSKTGNSSSNPTSNRRKINVSDMESNVSKKNTRRNTKYGMRLKGRLESARASHNEEVNKMKN